MNDEKKSEVLSSEGSGVLDKRYGKLRGPQAGSSMGIEKHGRI